MKKCNRKMLKALYDTVEVISDVFLCGDPDGEKYPELWALYARIYSAIDRVERGKTVTRLAQPTG